MGDERGDDADQRRADHYSSARIGAAAALTIVLVVLLVLDVAVPDYDITPGILLPLLGAILRAPGPRGRGVLEGREVTTVTALLTNKAYGYPTRGARRRRSSRRSSPACTTAPPTAANPDRHRRTHERNYANRAGSGVRPPRPTSTATARSWRHRPRQVRGLERRRRRAPQHQAPDDRRRGRVGREHERVGARVDRVLGRRDGALHRRPVRGSCPARGRGAQGHGSADQPQHGGRPRRHQQREPAQRPLAAGHP